MSMKKIYGEIAKTEELDDGTVKVWGYASSGATDADGEIITPDAMKAALPDYMKFGAVREMHQAKAAGTAIEANVEDDGRTFFGAHVVDSEAVKKVRAGVYKGFSIGGKITGRDNMNKTIITGINLVEVSLVDRPANPEAVFTMYKAELLEEPSVNPGEPSDASQALAVDELADLLDKGVVTPAELVAFAKSKQTAEPEPTKPEPVQGELPVVEKGMWNVADFAGALRSLSSICSEAEWEKQYEGDSSPIPAQLREWLSQGTAIFQAMAAEELAEMLADLKGQAGETEVVELAATTDDLAKVQAIADDLQKAFDVQTVALADATASIEAFGKVLSLIEGEELLTKVEAIITERDELLGLKKSWDDAPAKAKAILKIISKGEDLSIAEQKEPVPVKKADGAVDEAATAIKKIHSSGGQPFMA